MTTSDYAKNGTLRERWPVRMQARDHSVETLQLRSGASLILSRFHSGAASSFEFTETRDTFGFGFHLRGGACFEMNDGAFATSALDVWTSAAPGGSTSRFTLPPGGFLTVSLRFDPVVADEFFAEGLALPRKACQILKQVREGTGAARLGMLSSAAVTKLHTMFTTPYDDCARHLYLESCALDLLAGQVASHSEPIQDSRRASPRHRDKAIAARDYLDKHLRNPPTIAELAKIVCTNDFTLKRAFRETLGTTIYAYVSRRRMEHATTLLQQGMTVTSAAHEVGYECPRSFSAAFRRATGRNPSAISRSLP